MGMTMTEKILARHAGRPEVSAGDLLVSQVDLVLANDITGPPAINEFKKIGKPVFDKTKIALVPDHFSPCKDIKAAAMCKTMRDFARENEIKNYFEVGRMGIEHTLLPDNGLVAPGEIVIGADSHTCTYGAVNALSTGMGSTDIGCAMASGTSWFKVPAAIKVELTGKLPRFVKGKDVILTLIGMIGVDGARYQSLEFCGDGVAELEMADRFTICNMAIEAGAKNGIFPVDEKTKAYLKGRVDRDWQGVEADADASYVREIKIELDKLVPVVAYPHLPENTHPAAEGRDIKIDQVVVGSCTNGRLEDLRVAASIMKGHHKAENIHRVLVVPASSRVRLQAEKEGLDKIFKDFGAEWRNAGCSMCLGMNPDKMVARERSISTSNRNFEGRQGKGSRTHLASPAVAAATAIRGTISSPADL